jgi:hypothetical protein
MDEVEQYLGILLEQLGRLRRVRQSLRYPVLKVVQRLIEFLDVHHSFYKALKGREQKKEKDVVRSTAHIMSPQPT